MNEFNSFIAADEAVKNFKKPKNQSERSELERLKSERNKFYNRNKKFLIDFEKTNYDFIILLKSTNDFWKMVGHSALFYAFSVAPKLNLTANLKTDGDYNFKSAEGIISIRDSQKLTAAFKTLDIKAHPSRKFSDDFIIFKLPWTFSEDQLAEMIDHQNQNLRHFNQLVMVDNTCPVLFLQLEELLKVVYENIRILPNQIGREAKIK